MKKLSLLIALFVTLAWPSVARAQDLYDLTIRQSLERIDLSNRLSRIRGGGRAGGAARSTAGKSSGPTTFRSSANSIVPRKLAAASASTPAERQKRAAFLEQRLQEYEQTRRRRGYTDRDVAVALTDFIASNYNAYVGKSVLKVRQLQGLHEQLTEALSSDASFGALSDREKQEMYETAAVIGQFIVYGYDKAEAAGNQRGMQQFQQMARENLEQLLGRSINDIKFTEDGLDL